MSTKNPKDKLSDKEVENLFEKHLQEEKSEVGNPEQADKIVSQARKEASSKNVAEYALVKFWTGVLEFCAIFGMLIQQKSVDKNNDISDDEKSKRS